MQRARSIRLLASLAASSGLLLAGSASGANGTVVPSAEAPIARQSAASPDATHQRLLYSSDWSGSGEIYSVDPARPGSTRQLTFGRAPACLANPGTRCGYGTPAVSPDDRWMAYSDYAVQAPAGRGLYVARADGRGQRPVARVLGTPSFPVPAVWAPDSRRLAYEGVNGIHVVRRDGGGGRLVRAASADGDPGWSPDGRWLAFVSSPGDGSGDTLLVARGGAVRAVAKAAWLTYAWSPTSDVIAYADGTGLHLVGPTGSRRHRVVGRLGGFSWSPDGRFLAFVGGNGRLEVVQAAARTAPVLVRDAGVDAGSTPVWSPDGRLLAFSCSGGVRVADVRTGSIDTVSSDRPADLTWSPDSRSLAYRVGTGAPSDWTSEDLRVATLDGKVRTAVRAAGAYGGSIGEPVWTRQPAGLRYRRPVPRSVAVPAADGLVALWPIERIAADGNRVAYVACGHVFVWTPATNVVAQTDATASLSPACSTSTYYTSFRLYSLALAGQWVAFGAVQGGNGRTWSLGGMSGPGSQYLRFGGGYGTNGGPYQPVGGELVGELAGSGSLLVLSAWREAYAPGSTTTIVTTRQEIRRTELRGCPCAPIASSPGPLVPFDVDSGRIVAGGDNETWLLDASGNRLLTLGISPAAAQLSQRNLVVVRRGELRDYDATSGALLHTWPLPDVPSGPECGTPNSVRCYAWPRLVLEDAARGLVTYVLDGRVHVLRLSDGADTAVAPGSTARFVGSGLVYADGARLHLVPFDRLPLA